MRQLFILLLSFSFLQLNAQFNYTNNHRSKAFLGIRDTDMNKQKADLLGLPNAYGSYIKYVYEGTAAVDAGVEPFDYIIGIDDDRMAFHTNLTDLLAKHRTGDQVTLHIVRQGRNIELNATLGNSSDSRGKHKGGTAFLGIQKHNHHRDYQMGVTIKTVRNSSAIDLGLDDGDIIMAINGYPMVDWSDITTVLNNMDKGDQIKIDYTRNNQPNRASGIIGGENDEDDKYNDYSGRGFLGVYTGEMSMNKAELLGFDHHYGSYIKSIIPNTAADRARLEPLDYIVAINDYQLSRDRSLTGTLHKFSAGDEVTIHYIRNGQAQQVQAVLGEPSDNQTCSPCSDEPFFGVSQSGDNNNSHRGVKVNIVSNSAASRSGLQRKDIITQFNDKPLIDWSDLSAAINGTHPGEKINVVYIRDGNEDSTEVTIGSECDQNKTKHGDSYSYSYRYDDDNDNSTGNDNTAAVDMNRIKVNVQDLTDADSGLMRNQGIANINNLSIENISLFPNPSKGMFRLEFELPNSGDTSIKVFNSSGRIIYSFDLGEYSGLFSDEVDISQNGPGAYFLNVTQGNAGVTKKIVLQY